ncbi:MAG: hypothetical protein ABIY55_04755 [Kofleriaceae bacterium]
MIVPLVLTACLGPRVSDTPGASTHLLPSDATVPSVADDSELADQVQTNDGIDDAAFIVAGDQLGLSTGWSAGAEVHYWALGPAAVTLSPIYQLYDQAGMRLPHPALVDALPGDPGYTPFHTLNRVVVTDAYQGELITTVAALADAIDLGLIDDPEPTNTFVASPLVLPGTRAERGPGATSEAEIVYARGYEAGMLRFGDELALRGRGQLPTAQVSFLRGAHDPTYDLTRPIFQATLPDTPPKRAYTPVSERVDVDLAEGVAPATITDDAQLFVRTPGGAIESSKATVARFQVTPTIELLPLQLTDGSL